MSRTDIPMDRPLSDKDRAYLLMRGEAGRVEWFDQTFPPKTEGDEADAEVEDEGESDTYDKWTVAELKAKIDELNKDGAEISPASNKKDDLMAALREYDALPDAEDDE